jgi:hypothetical protein
MSAKGKKKSSASTAHSSTMVAWKTEESYSDRLVKISDLQPPLLGSDDLLELTSSKEDLFDSDDIIVDSMFPKKSESKVSYITRTLGNIS